MLYEDVDSCLLRLFESFLEAAPQLTWQLYIMIYKKPEKDTIGSKTFLLQKLISYLHWQLVVWLIWCSHEEKQIKGDDLKVKKKNK